MTQESQRAHEFCRDILPAVSRTFALGIGFLPGELGDAVCTAYLLCRIADTLEDDPVASAADKAARLSALLACFGDTQRTAAFLELARDVQGDAAHVRLVRNTDLVFAEYDALRPAARDCLRAWIGEMITGMRKFVLAHPAGIRIQTLAEFEEYCYYVAGTVGFLLTDLWRVYARGVSAARYEFLKARSRAFGQALQTVNILKDVLTDATLENSIYLPRELLATHGIVQEQIEAAARSATAGALDSLVTIARRDLQDAADYVLALPRRSFAVRVFCALPLLFAYATLRDITRAQGIARDRVVKISRREVRKLTALALLLAPSNIGLRALIGRVARLPKKPEAAAPRLATAADADSA